MTALSERVLSPGIRGKLPRGGFRQWGIYLVLAIIVAVSAALVAAQGGSFFAPANIRNILGRSVALGIVSVGQTLVILGASLDLSVAYLISVAAVLASFIMNGDPSRIWLAVAVVLAVGAGVGTTNGLLITKARINPFIATLGTGLLMRGLLSSRFSAQTGRAAPSFVETLGYGSLSVLGIRIDFAVILFAVVALLAAWVLRATRFGSHLYAVGGGQDVARLSGVRSDRVLIGAHILCSLTAAVTGLYILSRVSVGAPWLGPDGVYDLESIAAVVLGGTALMGGRGGIGGTVAGVLILAVLDSVFNALGVDAFVKQVLRGAIIIAAVGVYSVRFRSKEEAS